MQRSVRDAAVDGSSRLEKKIPECAHDAATFHAVSRLARGLELEGVWRRDAHVPKIAHGQSRTYCTRICRVLPRAESKAKSHYEIYGPRHQRASSYHVAGTAGPYMRRLLAMASAWLP